MFTQPETDPQWRREGYEFDPTKRKEYSSLTTERRAKVRAEAIADHATKQRKKDEEEQDSMLLYLVAALGAAGVYAYAS